MMNDRFSAELRQHLLATADERPGDGRLAAIVEGVAVTPQRHPLVARLPWSPARMRPFPSSALRYGLIVVGMIIAIVAAALFAGGNTAPRTVFQGTWTSIDPGDASTQTLIVGPGMTPRVHFEDGFATGAACVNDDVKIFSADGSGEISDDRLDVSFPDGGGCGSTTVEVELHFVYAADSDSLRDQDGLQWARVPGDRQPTASPTTQPSDSTQSPAISPVPSPHAGESMFTSAIHGFSIGVPKGWRTRAATEPWTGGQLDFDSPSADIVFDPNDSTGTYLVVASRPFTDMSADAWTASVLQWTCPEGRGEFWGWHVDGVYSFQRGPCNSGSLIATDTRGYLFRLVSPSDQLGLTDHWDALKPMLETVDLRPEDAIDPAGSGKPLPPCAEIEAGDAYTNRFGAPKLSATVPIGAESSWHGFRDDFELGATCPFGGSIWMSASKVDTVPTDPCDPAAGVGGNVTTPDEAAKAMAAHIGHRTSEPTEVTIDGRDALRVEISTEGSTCTDPFVLLDTEVAPGQDAIIYLVDLDGETLGIGVWYVRSLTKPAQLAEAEAIVESIRIQP